MLIKMENSHLRLKEYNKDSLRSPKDYYLEEYVLPQ